jgi:hypothetical protein
VLQSQPAKFDHAEVVFEKFRARHVLAALAEVHLGPVLKPWGLDGGRSLEASGLPADPAFDLLPCLCAWQLTTVVRSSPPPVEYEVPDLSPDAEHQPERQAPVGAEYCSVLWTLKDGGFLGGKGLDRMILVGEESLQRAVREFIAHYHVKRNHQGVGNRLILPVVARTRHDCRIVRRERFGGLLKYYHQPAA